MIQTPCDSWTIHDILVWTFFFQPNNIWWTTIIVGVYGGGGGFHKGSTSLWTLGISSFLLIWEAPLKVVWSEWETSPQVAYPTRSNKGAIHMNQWVTFTYLKPLFCYTSEYQWSVPPGWWPLVINNVILIGHVITGYRILRRGWKKVVFESPMYQTSRQCWYCSVYHPKTLYANKFWAGSMISAQVNLFMHVIYSSADLHCWQCRSAEE